NNYANMELQYGIRYSVQDKYNFRIGPKIGRNISTSSLRKDIDNNYWTYGGEVDGYIMLTWKLELNTDLNFDLRQKIPAFEESTNTNIILWNAELGKKIFKDKSGKL